MKAFFGAFIWGNLIFIAFSVAHAEEVCVARMGDHEFVVSIEENEVGFQTRAFFEDFELPSAGPCFELKRPSTNFWRCRHLGDLFDLEVYPQVMTSSGAIKEPQAILWLGSQPQALELICEESHSVRDRF